MSATDFDPGKIITALLSQGVAVKDVAKQLGLPVADVQKYVGANKPQARPQAQAKNALGKRKLPDFKWTTDNESILKSMWAQGHSSTEIAQNLGTTTDSVDKKVRRLIGGGWDGKDPNKKFAPIRSTSAPVKKPTNQPSVGALSSQVRNVVAGNGQSAARSKSFGQFAKRYVASGAAKSLEANFGLLGAWAASKLMAEQSEGKLAPGTGSSGRGGDALDRQAQVITTGVSRLGQTISRGTNMIARNISLTGEKTQTALGEIRENLKRLGGVGAPTAASRSSPTTNGASPAAAGGLGLLGGLAGGAAVAGIAKLFGGGGGPETKVEKTPTDPAHRGPEADKPETKAPGSKLDVNAKTMNFRADDIEFRAAKFKFQGGDRKAGGSPPDTGPISNPVGPADSPGGPGGHGGSGNESSGQPPTVGGPSSGPGGDQTFDQRPGDVFGGPSTPASPSAPGSVSGSNPGAGNSGGGWGADAPAPSFEDRARGGSWGAPAPGPDAGATPETPPSFSDRARGGSWGDRAPASPGAPPSAATPGPSSSGPTAPGPGPVDTSQFGVVPNALKNNVTKPIVGLASDRYNNPGAQWPGPNAVKYGMTGYGQLTDGPRNKIASFPHPVLGAASNMDLVASSKHYVGHTIGDALGTWTNQGSHSMPGFNSKQVITKEMANDPKFMLPFMKARADAERGGKQKMTDAQWQQAWDIKQAGGIDNYNKMMTAKGQPPGMIETAGSALGRGISAVGNAIVPSAHAEDAPTPPPSPSQSFKDRSGDMFDTPPNTGAELNKLSEPPPAPPPAPPTAAPSTFNDRAGDMFGWSGTADKDKTPPATSKTDHAFQDQVPGINDQVTDPYVGMGNVALLTLCSQALLSAVQSGWGLFS